jgi:hypothetical protein
LSEGQCLGIHVEIAGHASLVWIFKISDYERKFKGRRIHRESEGIVVFTRQALQGFH